MESLEQQETDTIPGREEPTSLRAQVVKVLGHGILTGKYKPGMRLNESQIARELNISRIPVREALSQLQEQGLVQNRERRGMFVTHIGPQEVEQIFALRLLLEGEALRLARINMTPHILKELEGIIARMEAWDGNLLESAALDLQFHRTLWKACANPYLERALNSLMVTLFAHKTLEHVTHDVRRWRLSHHRILLDAVLGTSGEDPQEVLQIHIRMAHTEPERYSALPKKPS
ncbi:MAG: GntR family transcriptional regulator [Alphaproteobacteria bacterium]|nr:GntR family transcriptional regulator [Alphaproteobacteria bacterium]